MGRKFTFLFLFVSFISGNSFSQTYVPLPLQNCSWYYSRISGTSNSSLAQTCIYNNNYKLYPNGDTIISGKRYIKMYEEWLNGGGGAISGPPCSPYSPPSTTLSLCYGLRQDTLARKIYIKSFITSNPESLLYDFNLVKNDTVKTTNCTFGSIPPCGTTLYRVIDSVYYQAYNDGVCRKTYKLKPYVNCANFTAFTNIIEGKGTEIDLTSSIASTNNNFGGFGMGSMTSISISTLVINTATLATTTNTCLQNVSITEHNETSITVYPNPAKDKILIEGINYSHCNIELINLLGQNQNVKHFESGNTTEVSIETVCPGIYILRISSDKGLISKKVIKLD